MARKPYDPLAFVPSQDVLREKIRETTVLLERLKILLELAVRLEEVEGIETPDDQPRKPKK